MNEDINREILNELRRLRRVSQWSSYLCFIPLALFAVYIIFLRPQATRSRFEREVEANQRAQQQSSDSGDVWAAVQAALDRGDNQKALRLAKDSVARQPGYHYAHATLGSVYIAINDFTNAETAYARAVELYPVEDHEKALVAIRKRLARDRGNKAQGK